MGRCKKCKAMIPVFAACTLIIGCTALFFIFPCPELAVTYSIGIPIYEGILTLFIFANFLLASCMDPGVHPNGNADQSEFEEDDFRVPLHKNVEIKGITVRMKWCTTCRFYRPPRCSHCSVCNHCIERFDHHCPWVSNCIGYRNYRYFFFFVTSLTIHMISVFVLCLLYVLIHRHNILLMENITCIAIMCVIGLTIAPVFGLAAFHVVLISRGRTTNEQVTGKFRTGHNPFNRGCKLNCASMLCGPNKPRYVTWIEKNTMFTVHAVLLPHGVGNDVESRVTAYRDESGKVRVGGGCRQGTVYVHNSTNSLNNDKHSNTAVVGGRHKQHNTKQQQQQQLMNNGIGSKLHDQSAAESPPPRQTHPHRPPSPPLTTRNKQSTAHERGRAKPPQSETPVPPAPPRADSRWHHSAGGHHEQFNSGPPGGAVAVGPCPPYTTGLYSHVPPGPYPQGETVPLTDFQTRYEGTVVVDDDGLGAGRHRRPKSFIRATESTDLTPARRPLGGAAHPQQQQQQQHTELQPLNQQQQQQQHLQHRPEICYEISV